MIPSGWKRAKIEDIADVASGGTPDRNIDHYWNGNVPWITTGLINFNTITAANEYITEDGLNNSSAKVFPKGTILMAMYGQGVTRGKVALLGIEAATNQACAAIQAKQNIDNVFLFYSLAHQSQGRHFNNLSRMDMASEFG